MKSLVPFIFLAAVGVFLYKSGVLMGNVDPSAAGAIAGDVDPLGAADRLISYATTNWMLTVGWPVLAITALVMWVKGKFGWAALAAITLGGILVYTLAR